MTNNDILRNLRFIFDFGDTKMISIFSLGNLEVSREKVSRWLKKEDHEDFALCKDRELCQFLDGLILDKRGKQEGAPPPHEVIRLTNNIIFRKLKIALNLKSDDVMDILKVGGIEISGSELSAFFRKANHKNFRPCKNQVVRNFLKGLRLIHRTEAPETEDPQGY